MALFSKVAGHVANWSAGPPKGGAVLSMAEDAPSAGCSLQELVLPLLTACLALWAVRHGVGQVVGLGL